MVGVLEKQVTHADFIRPSGEGIQGNKGVEHSMDSALDEASFRRYPQLSTADELTEQGLAAYNAYCHSTGYTPPKVGNVWNAVAQAVMASLADTCNKPEDTPKLT